MRQYEARQAVGNCKTKSKSRPKEEKLGDGISQRD